MAAIANVLLLILQIYSFVLLARVLMSWLPNLDPYNPIVQFLYAVTEPVLQPVREILNRQFGYQPMDFSPIVVFIGIFIFRILIISAF